MSIRARPITARPTMAHNGICFNLSLHVYMWQFLFSSLAQFGSLLPANIDPNRDPFAMELQMELHVEIHMELHMEPHIKLNLELHMKLDMELRFT